MREGKLLDDAVEWCRQRGVEFYAVNRDFPEERGTSNNQHFSRKIKADMFIDDRNVGGLPEWGMIYQMVKTGKSYRQLLRESILGSIEEPPKKKHWWSI